MSELTPITRKETFLAKAGGQNVATPTPITREETFLQAIIDNGGGGGGTGGGVLVVNDNNGTLDKTWNEINNASFAVIKVTTQHGKVNNYYISLIASGGGVFGILVFYSDMTGVDNFMYTTDSADGYPVLQD